MLFVVAAWAQHGQPVTIDFTLHSQNFVQL